MSEQTLYLKAKVGDVAPRVLLSGDPARVERAADLLSAVRIISRNREFSVLTGTHNGQAVSVVSGGIGAPSTAIALEELAQLGVKAVVRIGTMMSLGQPPAHEAVPAPDAVPLGTVVLSTGAVRHEGTSVHYLPMNYPAVPDWGLVRHLENAALAAGLETRLGLTATYDAFYPDMAPSLIGAGALDLSELWRAGVLTMDMETSLVFVLSRLRGMAAAAMCLVTVQAEPHLHLDTDLRAESDRQLVHAALSGLTAYQGV